MGRTSARQRGKSAHRTTGRFGKCSRRAGTSRRMTARTCAPFRLAIADLPKPGPLGPWQRERRGQVGRTVAGAHPKGSGKISPPLLPKVLSADLPTDSSVRPRPGGFLPSRSGGALRDQDAAIASPPPARSPPTEGCSATRPVCLEMPCSPFVLPVTDPAVMRAAPGQPVRRLLN